MLFGPPSTENAHICLKQEMWDPAQATDTWLVVYICCVLLYQILHLFGLIHQYSIVSNETRCEDEYDNLETLMREMYPEKELKKSLKYNQSLFKFLIVRKLTCEIPFYLGFVILYGPAYLWNLYLGKLIAWNGCEERDNFNI